MKYRKETKKPRIVIVSDDKLAQKSLYEMLCRAEYSVDIADSIKKLNTYLSENIYRVVLADINHQDHPELLEMTKQSKHPSEVIILASHSNIETAINSIRIGAFDYLVKPVEDEKLINSIEKALSFKPKREVNTPSIARLNFGNSTFHGLVGVSPTMNEIYSLIDRISDSKATVLLRGESGTGKRMIARAIHSADKKRKSKPFVEVSCGGLPREIIESELFGHTKGAFTGAVNDRKGRFELAHDGTILLDDIDSFSMDLQVKLLRVLQQKEFERVGDNKTVKVDVRIIASTNQDLEKLVLEKKFREDLYYRLNVISINLPPLRERKGDLPILIEYFVKIYSKENHKNMEGVSEEALGVLKNYNWPGNIRELENIIERAVILDKDGIINKDDLPEVLLASICEAGETVVSPVSLKSVMQEPEKVYILRILQEVGWNKKKAAVKLGVNRTTLYNKLKKYNLVSAQDKN